MSGIVSTIFKVPLDTLQFIRNNTLLSVLFFSAALVGIGLLNNDAPNPNNNIQPVGFDTTSINYFTNEQLQQMWEEWRLNALVSNNPAWATDHQFYYVYAQQAVGGNQLQTSDPIFGNGVGGFNKSITSLASGLYVVIVSQNRSNQIYYASLFQVIPVVNSNLNPSTPSNQITYPNTYKLSFYDVISSGNYF